MTRRESPLTKPERRLPLFLFCAFVLCAVGLLWGLPNHWDFAQDSVVPLGQLAQMNAATDQVTSHRYPPLHLGLLTVLFLPLRALVSATSIGQNAKLSATLFILVARAVSLAMTLGTLYLIVRIARRLWDDRTGLVAAALFVAAPPVLYYARNANLDMPYLFWFAWALCIYVRILQENRPRDYVWLGALAALSVCTKDMAYALFVLMPVPLILRMRRKPDAAGEGGPSPLPKNLLLGVVGFAVPFLLIHNILFNPAAFWKHVQTMVGPASQGFREFTRGPAGQLRLLAQTAVHLLSAWTPAGAILAGLGLWAAFRETERRFEKRALLMPAASYVVFFLCVIGYVYVRFLLPVLLILSLFAARGVLWLWDRRWQGKPAGKIAATALVGWVALAGLSLTLVMRDYSRYPAQRWLEDHCTARTRIAYVGDMRDMPRFNEPLSADPLRGDAPSVSLAQALKSKRPDVVVLSFERGHPLMDMPMLRLSDALNRRLRTVAFGRAPQPDATAEAGLDFARALLSGELGYVPGERFESPLAPFVPEVAESVNRTIVILVKEANP